MTTTLTRNTTKLKVRPTWINPVYNETMVVLESPNIISDNFKWIIDVWIDGYAGESQATKIATVEVLPNPDGFGVIDFSRHIQNYITSTFHPSDKQTVKSAKESYRIWSLDIREEFENPRWRFYDNYTLDADFVAFTNDSAIYGSAPDIEHPYINGDTIKIEQDVGYDHPSYNSTSIFDIDGTKSIVSRTVAWVSDSATNGGLASLVSTRTVKRILYQETISTSFLYRCFNGVINYQDFNAFEPTNYRLLDGSKRFLTNIPFDYNYKINRNQNLWLNAWSTQDNRFKYLYVVTNNGGFLYTNPDSLVDSYPDILNNEFCQLKVGYKDLLESTDTPSLQFGAFPVVDEDTTFISFFAANSSVSDTSRTYTINVEDECSKYEPIEFLFLDRLGSYLPISFSLVNKTSVSNDRKNYSQNYGRYDSVAEQWGFTSYDRGITTYNINTTKSVTATSNWMTEEEAEYVYIMLNSPDVYWVDNGVHRAITITTSNYDIKTRVNDKLINFVVSFEISQKDRNQNG